MKNLNNKQKIRVNRQRKKVKHQKTMTPEMAKRRMICPDLASRGNEYVITMIEVDDIVVTVLFADTFADKQLLENTVSRVVQSNHALIITPGMPSHEKLDEVEMQFRETIKINGSSAGVCVFDRENKLIKRN